MAQLVKARRSIAFGLNPKLALAISDPLRERILVELDGRRLSPSQFTQETGADLNRVSRCFRHLERCGYAEVIEERPGRRRGRSIEHVYRRTPNRLSDSWTWPGDPRVERVLSSLPAFQSYFARIVEAVELETFDQEIDRHLSWDLRAFDPTARSQLVDRLNGVYAWLSALEREAAQRARESTREVIPATVGLFAVPSSQSPEEVLRRHRVTRLAGKERDLFELSPEIANAMANRWRARILVELLARPMSPSQFVERVGGDASYVARCFRELADWGLIELSETRTGGHRRGGIERVYKAQGFHFLVPAWQTMPRFLRFELSSTVLAGYVDRLDEATQTISPGAGSDAHLVWRAAEFDRIAWRQAHSELSRILEWVPRLERESVERVGRSRRALVPTVLGLACFRSPPR